MFATWNYIMTSQLIRFACVLTCNRSSQRKQWVLDVLYRTCGEIFQTRTYFFQEITGMSLLDAPHAKGIPRALLFSADLCIMGALIIWYCPIIVNSLRPSDAYMRR